LSNGVICSKFVFIAESCCLQRISFRCRIVLSAANQHSLPKLCCLQWICVCCRDCMSIANQHSLPKICVLCSELVFAAESVCSAANMWFAAKIELSAANQRSLPKLSCLQWICDSLSKLSSLQWISICYWKCGSCSEFVIRCRNWVVTKAVARKIIAMQSRFLWGGSIDNRKIHRLAWETVAKAKDRGRLGVGTISTKN
jgi:hypothetical protein